MTQVLSILLFLWLALPVVAGQGRQTLVVDTDYSYPAVCNWVEKHTNQIEESSGSKIIETLGPIATLQRESKLGLELFRVQRTGKRGDYQAKLVQSIKGSMDYFECHIQVEETSQRQSRVTVVMIAANSNANSVQINVELRKSLRGMQNYLTRKLKKHD